MDGFKQRSNIIELCKSIIKKVTLCRRIIAKKNGNRETILYPRQEMLIAWINIEMMVEGGGQI